ncbi:MAG: DUF2510 domain-containing protein [Microbacteriaceae bacterium]|nr:DUF2510 domain-containing protein [Microbacteriaceae bacterium]
MNENTLPPPGWYQDPRDPDQLRWWDGENWTTHLQPIDAEDTTTAPVSPPDLSTVLHELAGPPAAAEPEPEKKVHWLQRDVSSFFPPRKPRDE